MLLNPVIRPVLSPEFRSVFDRRGSGGGLARQIAAMFAGGAPGVRYNFSDLTDDKIAYKATGATDAQFMARYPLHSLFQDQFGTIPVTAMEQPLGLALDMHLGGARGSETFPQPAFNSSTGLTLAANWSVGGGVATSNGGAGFLSAPLTITGGKTYEVSLEIVTLTAGAVYLPYDGNGPNTVSVSAPGIYTRKFLSGGSQLYIYSNNFAGTIDNVSVKEIYGTHAIQPTSGSRPTYTARVNQLLATTTLATQSATVAAASQTLSFTGTGTVTLSGVSTAGPLVGTGVGNRVSLTFTPTAGSLTLTVTGTVTDADLRPTDQLVGVPVYQYVTTSTDYDAVGFPRGAKGNAVNSTMYTSSLLDMSATNKVTVISSARKLSDVSGLIVCEFSANIAANNGVFSLLAPEGNAPANNVAFYAKGTALQSSGVTFPAPSSFVAVSQMDISGPVTSLRINGVAGTVNVASIGTGNLGSYPLYLFARAGTSLFFGGIINDLIVVGAAVPLAQIQQIERLEGPVAGVVI